MEKPTEKDTITFDTIREAWRREKNSQKLEEIENDFYGKVLEYIARKRGELESARSRGGKFGNKLVKQHENELENAILTLHQLFDLREKKILLLALAQSRTREKPDLNLTDDERSIFGAVLQIIRERRKQMLGEEIEQEEEKVEAEVDPDIGLVEVEFVDDTPKFLGLDLNTYGPFKKGDVEKLPKELSELLISRNKAKLKS